MEEFATEGDISLITSPVQGLLIGICTFVFPTKGK